MIITIPTLILERQVVETTGKPKETTHKRRRRERAEWAQARREAWEQDRAKVRDHGEKKSNDRCDS